MKKNGILNEHINLAISRLGHTDLLGVCDCGLPIPYGIPRVDISLVKGIPSFEDIMKALGDELVIEKAFIAEEMKRSNTMCYGFLINEFPNVEFIQLPHEELKRMLPRLKVMIRTGEATPYANIILQSGVNF